jgi:hypothetical protein
MQSSKFPVADRDNLKLIYSGLGSISSKERKRLKNIAESLVAIQNRPGTPIPDSIYKEIMLNITNDN